MTAEDRARAEALVDELRAASVGAERADAERFGLIAKLLLTYPLANASAETGRARGEAYRDALNDVPPAVVAEAIRRWNRGEAGQEHDYRWAPAPAVLRAVCHRVTAPLADAIADLETLLSAVTIERAMDPNPLEHERDHSMVPMLRRA